MNLSMIFLVLSAFIAFLLYDMFKKSRQQQQLSQVNNSQKQPANKLRPSYQGQCQILRKLHQRQLDNVKHKNVSIHLEEEGLVELSEPNRKNVVGIIKTLLQTHNVYLLVNRKKALRNQLIEVIREAGATQIDFSVTDGAVAVLRQLSCGTHLQGNLGFCIILLQYLPGIWLGNISKHDGVHHFPTQLQMILNLECSLKKGKDIKQD